MGHQQPRFLPRKVCRASQQRRLGWLLNLGLIKFNGEKQAVLVSSEGITESSGSADTMVSGGGASFPSDRYIFSVSEFPTRVWTGVGLSIAVNERID